jgi:hypothetical protein
MDISASLPPQAIQVLFIEIFACDVKCRQITYEDSEELIGKSAVNSGKHKKFTIKMGDLMEFLCHFGGLSMQGSKADMMPLCSVKALSSLSILKFSFSDFSRFSIRRLIATALSSSQLYSLIDLNLNAER